MGRRGLVPLAALVAGSVPVLRLRGGEAVVLVVALAAAAIAGVAGAAALRVLRDVRADERLGRVSAGFAVVPVVVVARSLLPVEEAGADAALRVVQWAAVPVLALTPGSARRGAVPAGALLVVAALLALVPSASAGLVAGDGSPAEALAVLELALAVLATVAVVLWLRRSPGDDDGPHLWVAAGLVVTVLAAAGRVALPDRDGWPYEALVLLSPLAVVLPAAGLVLSSCRPYRRQARRWRQLESQVRGLRASSPLLPGPSVTPEDEDGLPSAVEVRALLDGGLVGIALQPFVALADGAVVGHEALARFGGRVPTDRWFRGAGLHGLSEELELLTLRAALSLLPTLDDDVLLAVNLSPLALADDAVHAELQAADLTRVVVEITEHEAVRDYATARAHIAQLRAAGARIAVDDTGAGFASLQHVLMLRPDIVKLDQSLTRGIDHDARQRALVVALTRFAAEVGVGLVAEGVETSEQAAALRQIGLEVGQGWGLGVPVLQRTGALPG